MRAAPSVIKDAGIILLPLILHHCKIPGELLVFPAPSSSIHVVCVQAEGELLMCLGLLCIHTTAQRLSSKLGNFPAPHLPASCITASHPLPPTLSPPLPAPRCICADGPIFPHPQTGDVIRGNLICLECSGDGRKLFCSNICKCIHHGVPGNPSLQADDFVIFMKV